MMVTDFRCWWQNHYVGDFFRYVGDFLYLLIGHQHLKLVTNTFISNIRHQHRCNLNPQIIFSQLDSLPLFSHEET